MNVQVSGTDREQASRRLFDRWARSYDRGRITGWFQYTQQLAIENLALQLDSRVLDVGCGTGHAALTLAPKLPEGLACGMDISSAMVAAAHSKVPAELRRRAVFVQASSASLPYAGESFDHVMCTNSFHHYPDPLHALAEMKRVLRPGGQLVIFENAPDLSAYAKLWDCALRMVEKGHVRYYPSSELGDMIRVSGFEELELRALRNEFLKRGKLFASIQLWSARKARARMGFEPAFRAPPAGVPGTPDHGYEHEVAAAVRSSASDSSSRVKWAFAARLAFTLGLLVLLFSRVDLAVFADSIRGALGYVLLIAVASNALALVISAAKWDHLLRGVGVRTSKWMLLQLYTMGFFVNAFLPGIVGGDVVRWQMAGRRTGERLKVAATIVAERATGLAALIVLSVPAAVFLVPRPNLPLLGLAIGGFAIVVGVGLAVALNRRLAIAALVRARRTRTRRLARRLYGLHRTLRRFPRRPLLGALGFSVLFYMSAGFTFFIVCRAFDAPVTIVEATAVQVLIMLLIMIPISIGGLGLAQAGDVYLLGLLGVGAAEALGISVARMMVAYVYAVVGAFLFSRWQGTPEPSDPASGPPARKATSHG